MVEDPPRFFHFRHIMKCKRGTFLGEGYLTRLDFPDISLVYGCGMCVTTFLRSDLNAVRYFVMTRLTRITQRRRSLACTCWSGRSSANWILSLVFGSACFPALGLAPCPILHTNVSSVWNDLCEFWSELAPECHGQHYHQPPFGTWKCKVN